MKNDTLRNRSLPTIALLLMLAQAASPASGQGTVDRVKVLLTGFGVRGRLRLQSLYPAPPPGQQGFGGVVMTDARGNKYTAYTDRSDQIVYLIRGREQDSLRGQLPIPLVDRRAERRVRGWLVATETREPTRLASLVYDEKGVGHATFPILRNGYPFVSNPRYGYEFAFAVKTGEFLSFHASENPPSVDSAPARLDKNGALAALKRIWDTQIIPRAQSEHHWRVWYELHDPPELGYYLPKGRPVAILVWKIRYGSFRDVGFAIQGGDNAMLIDANTGEQIPTEVVP